MNDFNVVTVATFGDFISEVTMDVPVRICLSERQASSATRAISLDLQGFNRYGELIWLSQQVILCWTADGPALPGDQLRYAAMRDLRCVVAETLAGERFEYRPGRYVLPEKAWPINGSFAGPEGCARIEYEREDGSLKAIRVTKIGMRTWRTS